jgi:hypothetical protein
MCCLESGVVQQQSTIKSLIQKEFMRSVFCRQVVAAFVFSSAVASAQTNQEIALSPPPTPEIEVPENSQRTNSYKRNEEDAPLVRNNDFHGRVRWGISSGFGGHDAGWGFDGVLAAEFHGGYQFGKVFSVYASFGASPGISDFIFGQRTEVHLAAVGEVFLNDFFYAAVGPMASSEIIFAGGAIFYPGLDVKAGLTFGKAKDPSTSRKGFTIGIDVQTIFRSVADYSHGGDVGRKLEANVTPLLMFGFESR